MRAAEVGKEMTRPKLLRATAVGGAILLISLLHYQIGIPYMWLHQVLQRGYYLPVLLAALWFGWRGGILAASLAGLTYAPHILHSWGSEPAYSLTQYIEIGMFFIIGALTGLLADQEKRERRKMEITAQKLSEVLKQLQASFEQLRRADRLAALGELSAGLAHEIRNPLGSIEGAIQILRRIELPEATRQEFGDLAQKEANRLKGLLTNFLGFARPMTPRREPTDLQDLLNSVGGMAAETAKMSGVKIQVDKQDSIPTVSVDSGQIQQVLLNLVINAIQAMPKGGTVTLRASSENGSVVLQVLDEGIGIDMDDLERIFDPFFTKREGGTGLGLSIAYQIANQHGGHIQAQRNPERGMAFTVTLPLVQDGSPAARDSKRLN